MVQVRPAGLPDIAEIVPLVERYWRLECIDGFESRSVETTLAELLSHPKLGGCWVAENRGTICGYLVAVYMLSIEHRGLMAEIDEIFVDAQQRSAGVGSRLICAAERNMASLGIKRLQLQLKRGNGRGLEFYQRLGFRRRADYELIDKALGGMDSKGD